LIFIASGCTIKSIDQPLPSASPASSTKPGATVTPVTQPSTKPGETSEMTIKQDNDLTDRLKKEKEILDGRIYTLNGNVYGTMIIKNEIKQSEIDDLVNKYGVEIRKAYKECKINIQAVQNGKNVANKVF
jgi:hypothetical protein